MLVENLYCLSYTPEITPVLSSGTIWNSISQPEGDWRSFKKRFSKVLIIAFLPEAAAWVTVKDLYRQHQFLNASYYLWRRKFNAMTVP
ncbi:MAG: hypothetical protein E8D52_16005 [Nitrospira sp.]|nr:MAG: hypothetical protein E8D52_16005 [Nitrospira sp.]